MSEPHRHMANLGALVSEAESLRARALAAMQEGPAAPADPIAVAAYDETLSAALTVLGLGAPAELADARLEPGTATTAQLHRAAGLLEHALLVRLAETRRLARDEERAHGPGEGPT